MLNGLTTIYKTQRLKFINKRGIFIYLAIVSSWLSNLVKQYAAMARYLESSLHINELPHTIIHLSLFINHLKITLKVMLKQKSNHFIVQSLS